MKVDGTIKSLLQGVSQQPPRERLPGQCTEMQNMSADPLAGLIRRSPSDLVTRLASVNGAVAYHELQTKNGNKYLAQFRPDGIDVFDLNGIAQPVTAPSPYPAYMQNPANLKFGTLNNTTFAVNTSVQPKMAADTKRYRNTNKVEAIVEIIGGAYGRKYVLTFDNSTTVTYQTPNGASAAEIANTAPSVISVSLRQGIASQGVLETDGDTTFYMRRKDGGQFSITGNDDAGGTMMKVTQTEVARVEDLPTRCVEGFVVRVVSANDPDKDVYYMFHANQINRSFPQEGVWKECVAPGIPYKLDAATMPYALSYDADTGGFTLAPYDWAERQCGNEASNPDPSFIGELINDVSSFQSRLVLLAGPNVVMSRTNRSRDFWQASATALADTDPVDVSSTAVQGTLRAAIPHDKDLVIFSQRGQFVVFGRTALTPKNAALVLTTSFEADLQTRPVPAGRNVFFPTVYGDYAGIREFYTEGGTDINDSRPTTQHCKKYIEGKVVKMAASSNYEVLLVSGDKDRSKLFVYQYIWSDNSKVQSAWSTWKFHADIVYTFFDDAQIYMVMSDGNDRFLHRMSLDQVESAGLTFPVYMDSRFDVTGLTRAFALPYDMLGSKELIAVQGPGCPNPGMTVRIGERTYQPGTGWVCVLTEDMRGGDIVVGVPFESRFIPTAAMVKDSGGVPIAGANIAVKHYVLALSKTGQCTAKMIPKYGDMFELDRFEGRVVGEALNRVGQVAIVDEKFVVPFREDPSLADLLVTESGPYPMGILAIDWYGKYNKVGRRITSDGK